jgi:iron complex outermembrane recepter protein
MSAFVLPPPRPVRRGRRKQHPSPSILLSLGLVGASLAGTAGAQADPPTAQALEPLQVTGQVPDGYGARDSQTAGKQPLDLMKTPQSVQVITGALIEDFQPVFLDDILRSVSGINQTNTFGNTADGVTVRGFQPFEYFRNGIRTLNSRNLTPSTERIEILKGPSSLLYGTVEPGGLINVISKRPRLDGAFTRLAAQFSDRGGQTLSLDTGAPLAVSGSGQLAWRLVAERDDSDYWRNFGAYENTFIAPSLRWQGERLRLTAAYEYIDNDGPFDRGTVVLGDRIAPIPSTRRLGEPFERLTQTMHIGEVQGEFDLAAATTLRFSAAYQDSEGDDLQARPRFVTTDTEGNPVLRRRVDGTFGREERQRYLSVSVLHLTEAFGTAHQLLVGVDAERGDSGRAGFIVGPDETADEALRLFDPVYGRLDPTVFTELASGPFQARSDTLGLYLQDVISLGERWTLLLGGRYEQYDSESRTATVDAATLSDDSTVLPRAGLVFQPVDALSLYLSYSESFRPNTFTPDTFAPGSPTAFDPERGISQEVGAKWTLGAVSLGGAVFQIDKKNVLRVENTVPFLIDTAEVQGVELDIAGEPLPSLSLQAGYAYLDSDDGSGRPLTNVARHTFGLSGTWRLRDGALSGSAFGISGQYVDDRNGGANPGASPGGPEFFKVPQYTVVDLFAAYEWQRWGLPGLRTQLNLKNALDEDYFPSSGGSLRVNPGQARTLFISASVRF